MSFHAKEFAGSHCGCRYQQDYRPTLGRDGKKESGTLEVIKFYYDGAIRFEQPRQGRDQNQADPRGRTEEQGQRTQKRRPQRDQTIARQNVENPAHIITTFVYFVIISQPKGACPPGKTVFVPEKPPLFLVKPGIFGYNGLCIQTTKPKGDLYVQV